ncbi:hypothetical protein K435DRAFT_858072 [Dendrothele bispora CBS 962.96]|uniref:Uncharacterized protein n=1 Tax=Dendrothele bispora (strain CBS 962.96) TaxID=1314807 RepID=A0A4S8M415_DENBC|nr:hypothetical protein K435DRAFT_858072 [Dendrothele bispora CBS 962.96]
MSSALENQHHFTELPFFNDDFLQPQELPFQIPVQRQRCHCHQLNLQVKAVLSLWSSNLDDAPMSFRHNLTTEMINGQEHGSRYVLHFIEGREI